MKNSYMNLIAVFLAVPFMVAENDTGTYFLDKSLNKTIIQEGSKATTIPKGQTGYIDENGTEIIYTKTPVIKCLKNSLGVYYKCYDANPER